MSEKSMPGALMSGPPALKTPLSLRRQVVLTGPANAGKSTLFNALTGQPNAIVSPLPGTTTDPVTKAMELIPFGPIALVDTAGLDDRSELGKERVKKSVQARRRADAAIYVADAGQFKRADYQQFQQEKLKHLLVFTKIEAVSPKRLAELKRSFPQGLFWEAAAGTALLHRRLSDLLAAGAPKEKPLIGDLVTGRGHVILVIPIDSEAPKGRLILPQVQVLRECLDYGITATVCRETELDQVLYDLPAVDLVVTDSQVFAQVSRKVPDHIRLTSFSLLLARQKGDFELLLAGASALEQLADGDRILMLEGCTHNHTHEDIGRVKIPAQIKNRTGKQVAFEYHSGYDFPADLTPYKMAIQCGSCMLNEREIASRLMLMKKQPLPVTNYGLVLAWGGGILSRACRAFREGGGK